MYRVVRERRWQGGDAYVWSGAKPAVEVDYAHHVLAALVEGELAATQDYGAVIARLSSVRDSLPQMPRSLARYLRYLWVTLRYDGPTIVGIPGGPGHGAGPADPSVYGNVFKGELSPIWDAPFWDPWRAQMVDPGSMIRWAADRGAVSGRRLPGGRARRWRVGQSGPTGGA